MHVYDDETMRSMFQRAGFPATIVTSETSGTEPLQMVHSMP